MDMQQVIAGAQGQPAAPAADPKILEMLTQARGMIDQAMQMMGPAPEAAAQQAGFESVDAG